jgi:hypothetical protein
VDLQDNLIVENAMGIWMQSAGVVDFNCLWGNRIFGQVNEKRVNTLKEMQESQVVSDDTRRMMHGFLADPKLAAPERGDFRLAPDSPCRGVASDKGDMGADGAKVNSVIDGSFDSFAWLRDRNARRLLELARSSERKREPAEAVRRLRAALAFAPGDASIMERLKALESGSKEEARD